MTTKKIYGPWIKWNGGARPVPRDTLVEVRYSDGSCKAGCTANCYLWRHADEDGDIVEYRIAIKQADLDAAEQLLRDHDYTVTPPAKPLTFEDVVPITEAPPRLTRYWVVSAVDRDGVYSVPFANDEFDNYRIKRRMAYLDKEHALIAARHIFGLKGGEL